MPRTRVIGSIGSPSGGSEDDPVARPGQPFDQGLEPVELVLAGDQGGAAGLDDHQVGDAEGGDQAAVVGRR